MLDSSQEFRWGSKKVERVIWLLQNTIVHMCLIGRYIKSVHDGANISLRDWQKDVKSGETSFGKDICFVMI